MDLLEYLYINTPSDSPPEGYSSDWNDIDRRSQAKLAKETSSQPGMATDSENQGPASPSVARGDFSKIRRERNLAGKVRRSIIRFIAPLDEDGDTLSMVKLTPRENSQNTFPSINASSMSRENSIEVPPAVSSGRSLLLGQQFGTQKSLEKKQSENDETVKVGSLPAAWFRGWKSRS